MKRFRTFLAAILTLALLAFAVPAASAPADENAANHVASTVLVKFKPGVNVEEVIKAQGLLKKGQVYDSDVFVLEGPGKSATALAKKLSDDPNVEYAELDYIATVEWTPNDPSFGSQWGPKKVQAEAAWNYTQGSSSVLIAIVDTGVDLDHPDLINKVRTDIDWDYVNNDATAMDDNGHGTHCAGIAAAQTNNAVGIAGMCPNCQVLPVKVLNSAGSGAFSAIASGIRYAADKGAKVISVSLGGTSSSTTLSDAVTYADGKGSLVIAAAGNNGNSTPFYPAAYTAAVAVAATDSSDYRASFSNYGSYVDVAAPGVSIYSTYWNNTYKSLNGTSMAAPHVSGLAGLLFSQGRTKTDVRARLTGSTYTDPVNSTSIGRRINALKAVSY
ncbi:MAG TPA: S8 family peptidase [Symbiobacteriaceae bacterium]|nr:S8 family peptidase [Symbiobacteriaceae bacterium]